MQNIDQLKEFVFPYDSHRFSGQATDERILYITREHKLFLFLRLLVIFFIALAIFLAAWVFSLAFHNIFAISSLAFVFPLTLILLGSFSIIGWWWVYSLWKKSLAILTNKRLVKLVYTTPFNRYNQSLPLDMIVDTSCNNQGFFEGVAHSLLQIGTLTARSSASSSGVATEDTDRVNKKYFYLENIKYCEYLQQYLNKILHILLNNKSELESFRPFIAHLKCQKREQFLNDYSKKIETKE
jgi:Zn-dependent protease with chaperone function